MENFKIDVDADGIALIAENARWRDADKLAQPARQQVGVGIERHDVSRAAPRPADRAEIFQANLDNHDKPRLASWLPDPAQRRFAHPLLRRVLEPAGARAARGP